ncbi:MAG: type II secretion system protein [Kiritimatiellae bacterium]|nr:type II secretion system protein [Kiritimatiellia bacterium]
MKKIPGFTLIELLVVIAVIAVLIAILLPTLVSIKEYARRAGCRSHLRQLAAACEQYKADNKGIYPPAWGAGPGGEGPANPNKDEGDKKVRNPLYPNYLNDLDVCICPSCVLLQKNDDDGYYYGIDNGLRCYFYEYNYNLNYADSRRRTPKLYSRVILYYDQDDYPPQGEWYPANHMVPTPGGHILFCDSHIEWVDSDDKREVFDKIDADKKDGGYGDYK